MISTSDLISKFKYALSNKWGYIWGTAGEKWTAAKQAEIEKTTDKNREKARQYGSKWIGHYVADCSGLFSWAFKQLGGYMYHGSDTMFRKYTTANGQLSKGKRTDGQTLLPGTALFTYNSSDKKYGHVGLFIGDNTVIEAEGTIHGVVTSKASGKWTYWGELKGVDYGHSPSPEPPTPTTKPTIRRGDSGQYVTLAQTELINKGYSCGSFGADGQFGAATEKAVIQFQKDHNLTADGIIGAKTWAALDSTEPAIKYTVTIPHLSTSQAEALLRQYPDATKTEERG